ncbi:MAG: flagellar basal body protein [Burkholderiales bacterium]|nr:flagellar basal body protein [Burkholderiales bacterium]MDW8468018.1 flagellar basal body protein [Burkholderiales bacterium]
MMNRIEDALRTQATALALRAHRQSVLASNIANADTPGYRAVDFDFARALREALARPGAPAPRPVPQPAAQPSADGNTVDMDAERAKFADNAVRYEAALRALNGQIRTLLDAIRG